MMRKRRSNFEQMIKNIVDQYPEGEWHGLQKDAIQNGWDARKSKKKGLGWHMEFDLTTVNGKKFFIIRDFGTTGLTGKLTAEGIVDPENMPESEKWAKFEYWGATKHDSDKLGSRGQGKFLFIYASKDDRVFYDSLRDDDTYRFGLTEKHGEDVNCWDEGEGRKEIKKRVGLDGLSEQGTRIIIENPKKELIQYYESGKFLDAIEEVWWPLIRKFDAKIVLKNEGEKFGEARVPSLFQNFSSQKYKEEFENLNFKYGADQKGSARMKHLKIACNDSELERKFVGIAVFRDGMKVCSVPFDGSQEFNKKIFGYVEFDNETEKLLREIETPNHYDFNNKKALWSYTQEKVKSEMIKFAEKHLGLGKKEPEGKKNSQRERQMKALVNNVLKELDIPINPISPGPPHPPEPRPHPPVPPSPPKDVCIYDDGVSYTEDHIKRISYGDTLRCECKIRSNTRERLRIKISIYSKAREILPLKDCIVKDDFMESKKKIGKNIEKGRYSVKFHLIKESKKEILDEKAHVLWVEDYPPGKFPFQVEHSEFGEEERHKEWHLNHSDKILYFNVKHKYYEHLQQHSDEQSLIKHEAEMAAIAAVSYIIREAEMDSDKKEKLKNNKLFRDLFSENNMTKTAACLQIQGHIRDIIWQ